MRSLGIDGCRAGWVAILRETHSLHWSVASCLEEALPKRIPRHAFIDMPIGLGEHGARLCDQEARRRLGREFSSSVFPCPARAVLKASTYEEANALNRETTGLGLSKQSFYLLPKIREVDHWLQQRAERLTQLREAHPEVAFMAIKGAPLAHKKKTEAGFAERLSLLDRLEPRSPELVEEICQATRRKDVAPDDVLDALCLAVMPSAGHLHSLPTRPPRDAEHLPMAIHYFA